MELTTRLGLEKIQREALIILFNGLNTQITSLQPTWTAEDDQLYAALSRPNPDWTVELIAAENFHPGTLKGLIKAPITKFPNVCTICYIAEPPGTDEDRGELYRDVMAIEIMVKSEESEEEVNSRIQKTLDAAHLVIWENRTLNNTVPEISYPPTVNVGDVQIRREKDGTGLEWFWQGGSLEYVVDKYVSY